MTPFARQLHRRGAPGVALLLLVAGCGGLRSQVSQEFTQARRAQASYHDGLARYEAQDYRAAIPLFERALAHDPAFDEAEASLAWSYYHVGHYPQATRHFRQTLARQPRWEGLHTGLGWSRYRVRRYHLALESFHAALALDPRYREAAIGRASALFELGRYAEALPHLERLTREGEGSTFQRPTAGPGRRAEPVRVGALLRRALHQSPRRVHEGPRGPADLVRPAQRPGLDAAPARRTGEGPGQLRAGLAVEGGPGGCPAGLGPGEAVTGSPRVKHRPGLVPGILAGDAP